MTPAQFASSLAAAPERVSTAVREELVSAGREAVAAATARLASHRDTGRLAGSIHADVEGATLEVAADASYAVFVEAKVGFIKGAVVDVVPGLERRLAASAAKAILP